MLDSFPLPTWLFAEQHGVLLLWQANRGETQPEDKIVLYFSCGNKDGWTHQKGIFILYSMCQKVSQKMEKLFSSTWLVQGDFIMISDMSQLRNNFLLV